jgi:hypothetical protein
MQSELHEDEVALLSESDSAGEIPAIELQRAENPNNTIPVEIWMNSEAQNDELPQTDHEVRSEAQDDESRPTTKRSRGQLLNILSRSSLFAIGLAILVVGGVASNYHPYYVDPGEYENCTTAQLNETMYM